MFSVSAHRAGDTSSRVLLSPTAYGKVWSVMLSAQNGRIHPERRKRRLFHRSTDLLEPFNYRPSFFEDRHSLSQHRRTTKVRVGMRHDLGPDRAPPVGDLCCRDAELSDGGPAATVVSVYRTAELQMLFAFIQ